MAPARNLVFHGVVVIFLGLVGGAFFGAAIVEGWGDEAVAAWKLVHLEGLLNGILMIAVAATFPLIKPSARSARAIRVSLLLLGYGNMVGSYLGAITGHRGLFPTGPAMNIIVLAVFSVAVVGALMWVVVFAKAILQARDE